MRGNPAGIINGRFEASDPESDPSRTRKIGYQLSDEIHVPTSPKNGEKWGTRNLPSSTNGVTADLVTFRIRARGHGMSLSLRSFALWILILSFVVAAPAK